MAIVATMPIKEMRPPEMQPVTPALTIVPLATTGLTAIEEHPQWFLLSQLPLQLTAAVPLRGFRVRDLVALKAGNVVASKWASTDDVPLKIGAVQLSWSEFEVVEQTMAVRLTRLA